MTSALHCKTERRKELSSRTSSFRCTTDTDTKGNDKLQAHIQDDVFMGAYTMLLPHIITVGSALLGIIRLDLLKKTEKI